MSGGTLTFSVIMPCMNSAPYLEKALLSVLSQQGDFRIQLIVMDGCSTDGSQDILAGLERALGEGGMKVGCRGLELILQSEEDEGQSDALNKALARIQGDVVTWLNADDWYAPGAFAAVDEAFRSDGSLELVFGNCLQMRSEETPLEGAPVRSFVKDPALVSPFSGGEQWVLVTPEVFFRRRCLAGFRFDLALDYFMDVDLWMHLFLPSPKLLKMEKTLAYFRWHTDCKTVRAWGSYLPELLVEDHILFSRYRERLCVPEAERAFGKLMLHFLTNWRQMGVFGHNDEQVRQLVEECPALDQNDRDVFATLYASARCKSGGT